MFSKVTVSNIFLKDAVSIFMTVISAEISADPSLGNLKFLDGQFVLKNRHFAEVVLPW